MFRCDFGKMRYITLPVYPFGLRNANYYTNWTDFVKNLQLNYAETISQ